MAYIGAETPNDRLLKSIRKGTRSEQTLEVAEICRANGVIPELSFMVAPPEDPEGETERTFDFIRQVKRVNPSAEIIVYVYTPLPADSVPDSQRLKLAPLRDANGAPVEFPKTPEEWTERRWVDYACHADAPWLSDRLRQRIRDFVTVLRCRFPTVQDTRSPGWAKGALRGLASWRYALRRYDRPWELTASQNLDRPARSARHEPLSSGAHALHVVQISFFVDPQRRSPETTVARLVPPRRRRGRRRLVQASASRSSRPAWCRARSSERASRFISWRPKPRALRSRAAARSARCCASSLPTCFMSMASASGTKCASCMSSPRARRFCCKTTPIAFRVSGVAAAWRSGAAAASGMSFCARAQAEPFRRARLLPPNVEIFEIPELTSSFAPGDAAAARAATGLHGDPAILVGRPPRREQGSADRARGRERRRARPAEPAALVLLCNVTVALGRRSAHRARRNAPRPRAPAGPRAARESRGAHARRGPVRARQSPRRRQLGARRSDGNRPDARRDRHPVIARPDGQRRGRRAVAVRRLARARNRAATRQRRRVGPARARRCAPTSTRSYRAPALGRQLTHRVRPIAWSGGHRALRAWSSHERRQVDGLVARRRTARRGLARSAPFPRDAPAERVVRFAPSDPFGERAPAGQRAQFNVLAVRFTVESANAAALQLAVDAFGGLPPHGLRRSPPRAFACDC